MTASKRTAAKDWKEADDAPNLSTPKWRKKMAAAPVKQGRPKLAETKISTTIRLDADIIASFRARGPRWQSRINTALREWLKRA
jgi:uncharacterized protein (DUF4415 family)